MKSAIKFRQYFVLITAFLNPYCSFVGMAKPMVESQITFFSNIVSSMHRVPPWSMTDANSIKIDQRIGDIHGETSCIIKPNATTIFSLNTSNKFCISAQTATISVDTVFILNSNGSVIPPKKTFADSDKPDTIKLQTFNLTTPWGYNKMENNAHKYPLVVNGCWGEGRFFSENVRMKYPSFYLDFNNYSTESDGVTLATLIDEAIKEDYRIDTNRIYLTGFSRGGSGSFKIVRGMLTKGKLFAGIIRVAGQSESVLPDEAVKKTSLWYHIGLKDLTERIDVAQATYTNLKGNPTNATAVESIVIDRIAGYTRTTKILTRNGIEIVKMSEYKEMGHEPDPCYNDPALFDWLFSQSLEHP